MLVQLEKINNIYDLLALCSSYILNELDAEPYEFALFEDCDYDEVYDAIDRYCCEKKEKGYRVAFDELRNFVYGYLKAGITIERCFAIVRYIDDLVELEISDKLLGGKGVIKYSAVNTQYCDRVKIIPKMKNTFITRGDIEFKKIDNSTYSLFRARRECACSKLDAETVNYMIWDQKRIEHYPMSIYRVDEKSPIAKHFCEREKIVFAIVPFTNKQLKQILDVKYVNRTFHIERMKEDAEKELRLRYGDVCERCKNEDIDFLIFPEMLMTKDIIRSIQNRERVSSPQVIVNGSIWKDYKNKSIVTDGNGKEIFSYLKKEPFKFSEKSVEYTEHLDSRENKEYTIMEIDGVGRIGVCICKDLINEEVKLFHKYVGTDILIVPAYTKSMDLQASAEGLSTEFNCIVVVANACSALYGKNESSTKQRIGFVTLPAKSNTDRSKVTQRYYKNECVSGCENKCIGKMITVDFCNTKEYDNVISYEMSESSF